MIPLVDARKAADILAELQPNLPGGLGQALGRVFARYCEIVIDRINQAPDKNLLAYLGLLGNSPLPPQAARAPLTFSLSARATEAVAPAGTQVGAPQAEGVIFQTERELVVTQASLTKALAFDARRDQYADISAVADPASSGTWSTFQGNAIVPHELYIDLDPVLFAPTLLSTINVNVTVAAGAPADRRAVWEYWDGGSWQPVPSITDGTSGLQNSGTINLGGVPEIPPHTVGGVEGRWIRCRWLTPISAAGPRPGMVTQDLLPTIQSLQTTADIYPDPDTIQAAFYNEQRLDISKDFRPFGMQPKAGDTFYLMGPAFSRPPNGLTLHFGLSDVYPPPSGPTDGGPRIVWECWTGRSWTALQVNDGSSNFTSKQADQVVVLQSLTTGNPAPRTWNGATGYWARARLTFGNYGVDTNLKPPIYKYLTVYGKMSTGPGGQTFMARNGISYSKVMPSFAPFAAIPETCLALGFSMPAGAAFPNRPISLYVSAAPFSYGFQPDNPSPAAPPVLAWEYWNGSWSPLPVRDGTSALTVSGSLDFLGPADFAPLQNLYWLRARWQQGDYEFEPRLLHILTNTVPAEQAITVSNETLGSSSGKPNQVFTTSRTPILEGQKLLVREPDLPPPQEQEKIVADEGSDAIVSLPSGLWVRWHEVPDFYASGPLDRHYAVDRLAGEIDFGDGRNGRIPPAAPNNILLTIYRVGGGAQGNVAAGSLTQLKTTVPYVDRVTNCEPASGGFRAEDAASLAVRGPKSLRHSFRAVTAEDYEDLARLAAPQVARAKCAPLVDIAQPAGARVPGRLSLVIVPDSTDAKPIPGMDLIRRVQDYVDGHRIATADLAVVGPQFVRVEVAAQVAVLDLDAAGDVESRLLQLLWSYLHPLTGGRDGTGWPFGRKPHHSELYALLASDPGVDYVRSLSITEVEEPAGASATGYALVYSGNHKITLAFG